MSVMINIHRAKAIKIRSFSALTTEHKMCHWKEIITTDEDGVESNIVIFSDEKIEVENVN